MAKELGNLVMPDRTMLFKNFAGRPSQFNEEGNRNFCVLLSDEEAEGLSRDGWNVKAMRPDDNGDTQKYMQVKVAYRGRDGNPMRTPPRVTLITSRGRTELDEGSCELIDQSDISRVDLIVRPYEWVVSGKTGVKAYLKEIYVTLEESVFARQYDEIAEAGAPEQLALEAGDEIWDADVVQDDTFAIER